MRSRRIFAGAAGLSLLIGFLLGFALRVFVRITVTLLVLGIGLLMLLSKSLQSIPLRSRPATKSAVRC